MYQISDVKNMQVMSAREAADKWNISQRRVTLLCGEGRVPDAILVGNSWVIPKSCKKPPDLRAFRYASVNEKAKPFIKWAGGKTQLIDEISKHFPKNLGNEVTKYAEPFVGGGAVLFELLSKYNLEGAYISDINSELINAYSVIKFDVEKLILRLQLYRDEYNAPTADRKRIYYEKRDRYNELIDCRKANQIEKAALFIFLNKTCFNGLYRVNKKGKFNVPMGDYKSPQICDAKNLRNVSKALSNVDIICADYKAASTFIDENTLVYFDPPYRPLTATAGFTAYSEFAFGDDKQQELADFVKEMRKRGASIIVSNSDPKNVDENDDFFDNLYRGFKIKRTLASRMINSKATNRGKISELIITT